MGGGVFGKEFARHRDLADDAGEFADEHEGVKEALEEALCSSNEVGTLKYDDPEGAIEAAKQLTKRASEKEESEGRFRANYSDGAVVTARTKTGTPGSSALEISYRKPTGQ